MHLIHFLVRGRAAHLYSALYRLANADSALVDWPTTSAASNRAIVGFALGVELLRTCPSTRVCSSSGFWRTEATGFARCQREQACCSSRSALRALAALSEVPLAASRTKRRLRGLHSRVIERPCSARLIRVRRSTWLFANLVEHARRTPWHQRTMPIEAAAAYSPVASVFDPRYHTQRSL